MLSIHIIHIDTCIHTQSQPLAFFILSISVTHTQHSRSCMSSPSSNIPFAFHGENLKKKKKNVKKQCALKERKRRSSWWRERHNDEKYTTDKCTIYCHSTLEKNTQFMLPPSSAPLSHRLFGKSGIQTRVKEPHTTNEHTTHTHTALFWQCLCFCSHFFVSFRLDFEIARFLLSFLVFGFEWNSSFRFLSSFSPFLFVHSSGTSLWIGE